MIENTLRKMVDAESISGFENTIRETMKKELRPHVDEIRVDKIGNLIARKGKGSPRIMLAAHMDELGLMVKHVDDKGFLYFETVGGWDTRYIPLTKVKIHGSKGHVIGVIGSRPPHIMDQEEMKTPVKKKDMFIDIGAKDKKDAEKAGVRVGDFITRVAALDKMLGTRITGPGLDNRIGCAVMVEAMKQLKGFKGTVYAVGTIQEEVGLVGVRGAAFGINPDAVIALDTAIGGDVPGVKPSEASLQIGKGPAVALKDAISFINPSVRKWLDSSANAAKVKIQYEVISGGAMDSSVVPMIREGIPAGGISVPTRHIHSTCEVADMKDLKDAVSLTVQALKSSSKYF